MTFQRSESPEQSLSDTEAELHIEEHGNGRLVRWITRLLMRWFS